MMKWMGLDVGDVRIGIAFSDAAGRMAFPREVYRRQSKKKDLRYFEDLIDKEQVEGIVYGLPLHMSGEFSQQAEKNQQFIDALNKRLRHTLQRPLRWEGWDERLSSFAADESLKSQGLRGEKRKEHIDAVAAAIILQNFLDHLGEQ